MALCIVERKAINFLGRETDIHAQREQRRYELTAGLTACELLTAGDTIEELLEEQN